MKETNFSPESTEKYYYRSRRAAVLNDFQTVLKLNDMETHNNINLQRQFSLTESCVYFTETGDILTDLVTLFNGFEEFCKS